MSRENVSKFYMSVSEDAEFAKALEKINEGMQQRKLAPDELNNLINSEIIPLAKKRGMDFTADELIAYSREIIKSLNDEDLENINGGLSQRTAAIALAFTLGSSFVGAGVINMLSSTPTQNQAVMSSSSDSRKTDRNTIPRIMREESAEPAAEAETKDIQEALSDKKIVLPGQEAATPEAATSVEDNQVMLDAAVEGSGEAEVAKNEASGEKNTIKEEKADAPVIREAAAKSSSAHTEDTETPVAVETPVITAHGSASVPGTDEIPEVPLTSEEGDLKVGPGDTTEEALKELLKRAQGKIENQIIKDFNSRMKGNVAPLKSEEISTFAAAEIAKFTGEKGLDLGEIKKETQVEGTIKLSVTGQVPAKGFWARGKIDQEEVLEVNVKDIVEKTNDSYTIMLKGVHDKKVVDEKRVIESVIREVFNTCIEGRKGVEFTEAELAGKLGEIKTECERVYAGKEKTKGVSFEGFKVDGVSTVKSDLLTDVQRTIDMKDYIEELNVLKGNERVKEDMKKAKVEGSQLGPISNQKEIIRQWVEHRASKFINAKVLEQYNDSDVGEKVDDISKVLEDDQRRIKLALNIEEVVKAWAGNEGYSDTASVEKRKCFVTEAVVDGAKKFVSVVSLNADSNIIYHTEEIDMKAAVQERLDASKLSYTAYSGGTATAQAEHLLATLNHIESLDEIAPEAYKAIKGDIKNLVDQMVIESSVYKAEDHKKADVDDVAVAYKKGTWSKKDIKAINDAGVVVVTDKAPLVLSGDWWYGREVSSDNLHKILKFYEASK